MATFNVRNGLAFDACNSWPFRRRATLTTLERLDADLIALQETVPFQLRWISRELARYEVVGRGRDRAGRGEHTPVLVRRDVARVVGQRRGGSATHPRRRGAG